MRSERCACRGGAGEAWTVVDRDFHRIAEVEAFLARYAGRTTQETYAKKLAALLRFAELKGKRWDVLDVDELREFVAGPMLPAAAREVAGGRRPAVRTQRLTASVVRGFYGFHHRRGWQLPGREGAD